MPNEPIQTFPTIWDALGEPANLRLRSELAIAIRAAVESWNLTQSQAAPRLNVTQPRLNDLLKGRLDRFSLDALVALAERAHLAVRLDITPAAA